MNLSARLDQFRDDNPYDVATQAKRLLASDDSDLIRYAVELGLTLAKSRQRHDDRQYIKETGFAPPKEKLMFKPGRVTGSVTPIVIKPGRRTQNAMAQFVMDTWRINGEQKLGDATAADLGAAIKRENASVEGHKKNMQLYESLREPLAGGTSAVRDHWTEETVREEIKKVFGEFRQVEAA